ncbi:hypothetical protein [Gracilibacillus kekensis]|uniref:Uncharacterized protein n=1 Tax=Gracilibacillus kekensis TaxID=1027249 RepID=A0A1M7QPX8_9BACI|nr:hypothetical protein [Gracilibacillus kekensis]SHN33628.1 hypothetical protein SAMN05216179_3449 [Gracilibacillus kekensis]
MNEDKLKMLLKEEYTENPILNYLFYIQKGKNNLPTPKKLFNKEYNELTYRERNKYFEDYGNWRKRYDLDVIHLNGNLNADTIFSIWMPLKMCLQNSGGYPYSEYGISEKPNKSYPYIPNIIKNIDTYLPYNEWEELYKFVSIALTEVNVMRLPDTKMQKRGEFYDQMPKTLYECYGKGKFAKCFQDIQVKEWVRDQNLTMFFENKISRENIKPLISRMNASDFEWLKNREEIKEMLTNYCMILEMRIGR